MAYTAITTLADLKLSAEEREKVAEVVGDIIAVQVYRELQKANAANLLGSSYTGCCCSGEDKRAAQTSTGG